MKNQPNSMTDHLGNVRAVAGYGPDQQTPILVRQKADYYPFGWKHQNSQVSSGENYRYGYQGEFAEEESDVDNPTVQQWNQFELRLWDGRIGRWMTTDPANQFHSPYLGMGNNPGTVDPDGAKCVDKDGNVQICPDEFEALDRVDEYYHFYLNGSIGRYNSSTSNWDIYSPWDNDEDLGIYVGYSLAEEVLGVKGYHLVLYSLNENLGQSGFEVLVEGYPEHEDAGMFKMGNLISRHKAQYSEISEDGRVFKSEKISTRGLTNQIAAIMLKDIGNTYNNDVPYFGVPKATDKYDANSNSLVGSVLRAFGLRNYSEYQPILWVPGYKIDVIKY